MILSTLADGVPFFANESLSEPPWISILWQSISFRPCRSNKAFADVATGLDVGPEFIDPEVGWSVIGAYQLAWIRYQLGDETVLPVLDGTVPLHPTAALTPFP